MNRQQALTFLSDHQPLPIAMPESLISELEFAVKEFEEHPLDPEVAVPLLLNCWNESEWDHLEVMLISALQKYPIEWIAPHIAFGLKHPESIRRMWFGEVAGHFPHRQYVDPLLEMLAAEENVERFISACVLERILDETVTDAIRQQLKRENDPEIIEVLETILSKI